MNPRIARALLAGDVEPRKTTMRTIAATAANHMSGQNLAEPARPAIQRG